MSLDRFHDLNKKHIVESLRAIAQEIEDGEGFLFSGGEVSISFDPTLEGRNKYSVFFEWYMFSPKDDEGDSYTVIEGHEMGQA